MSDKDRERDLENLQDFIGHLASTRFSGTVLVAFAHGAPTSVSRKEEMDPDALHRFLHRPVPIRKVKVAPLEPPPTTEPAKEPEIAGKEGTQETVPTSQAEGQI